MRIFFLAGAAVLCGVTGVVRAQSGQTPADSAPQSKVFTHADTLRGSMTPQRAWWDVAYYDLQVKVSPSDSSIRGSNGITYKVTASPEKAENEMQIDLRVPLEVDSMIQDGQKLTYRRDGDVFFAKITAAQRIGQRKTVTIYYHGQPRVAQKPPWDGGFVWTTDSLGHTWVSTACQGIGASVWWPTKDIQADEPDSQRIAITVPDPMIEVSNGRLRKTIHNGDGTTTYDWFVRNPINTYDVSINAGTYTHFSDKFVGEREMLTLDFWPLAEHLDTARVQFAQVKPMLKCFEHWFGPYPWYNDGYKLVETPFLGMEHQSAVAYGNHYENGYLGRDLSHTGIGLKWDFIIIHESGHEWFGNNITTKDVADMWVHEGFTNYSEGLYTECQQGKAAGAEYIIGLRKNVQNDAPVIGHYGVAEEGSSDMYYKASNMLHTMRQIVDNDAKWRAMLRGLNHTFWHKTVTGAQVQMYMNKTLRMNFDKVFEQYLTTTLVPTLQYKLDGSTLSYRWKNVVPGFNMPVRVTVSGDTYQLIGPTEQWKTMQVRLADSSAFKADPNFFIELEQSF